MPLPIEQLIKDSVSEAVVKVLNAIPELGGCLPADIEVEADGLSYKVTFWVPMLVSFSGA